MILCTAACTFIVHRQLCTWLSKQNCEHGVAPSRMQVIRRALSAVPSDCPLEVQACVAAPLRGSARQQRKCYAVPAVAGGPCWRSAAHFNSASQRNAGEGGVAGRLLGRAGNTMGRAENRGLYRLLFWSGFPTLKNGSCDC